MTDTFTTWRDADKQWAERNRDLLQLTFRMFMDQGKWPEVDDLQRFLHQSSIRSVDVRAAANSKPSVPGQLTPAYRPNIVLGSRYLLGLPEAQEMLALLIRATRQAIRVYLDPNVRRDQMTVSSSTPEFQMFSTRAIERFTDYVTSDFPNAFSGGGYGPTGFNLFVNQETVIRFEHVSSPEEYVERQFEMIRAWAEEQDRRMGVVASTGPARAFVVMPFEQPWSDDSFDFITRAVKAQGGALEAVRADRIDKTGRITEQIVEELNDCAVVIADITDNNANVAWELGFAWAREKPCAIIKQKQSTGAPFDIYDHRRVDYSSPPTAEELERLTAILRRAIGR
jgi:hypothetical protein